MQSLHNVNSPNMTAALEDAIGEELSDTEKRSWRSQLGLARMAYEKNVYGPILVSLTDTKISKGYMFTPNSDCGMYFLEEICGFLESTAG